MFCEKCGAKNADDVKFCAECGAEIKGRPNIKSASFMITNPNTRHRRIGIIAIVVIIVMIIIVVSSVFAGRSYKIIIDKFVNAQVEVDAEAIFELLPKEMISYVLAESWYDDDELDEMIDDVNKEIKDQIDSIERYIGKDWKVSYEILNVEDITGDDLEHLKKDYEEVNVKISAAKTAEVQLTVKTEETENSNTIEISVIKVGRSWYLDIESMGSVF